MLHPVGFEVGVEEQDNKEQPDAGRKTPHLKRNRFRCASLQSRATSLIYSWHARLFSGSGSAISESGLISHLCRRFAKMGSNRLAMTKTRFNCSCFPFASARRTYSSAIRTILFLYGPPASSFFFFSSLFAVSECSLPGSEGDGLFRFFFPRRSWGF